MIMKEILDARELPSPHGGVLLNRLSVLQLCCYRPLTGIISNQPETTRKGKFTMKFSPPYGDHIG